LALGGAASGEALYEADFRQGVGGFRVLYRYYGEFELAVDGGKRGPSGAPALRIGMAEECKGLVGTEVQAEGAARLRVELWGASVTEGAEALVVLRCYREDGERIDWQTLGRLPAGRRLRRFVSHPIQLPRSTARTELCIDYKGTTGSSWIADVRVMPVDVPAELEETFSAPGETHWGCNEFLPYAYTDDPTLIDTCAKLLVTAGLREDRVYCWWGSREQIATDLTPNLWTAVDREDRRYDFSALDRRLEELAYYGARPGTVVVHGTPEWASGKTRDDLSEEEAKNYRARRRPFFPPRDWSDYEEFVEALVSHFRGRVRRWEIMNEPNTPDAGIHYGYEDYERYLRGFYEAAKRADPSCLVLCGRVGADWLAPMLRDGMARYFDGLVVHPYHPDPEGAESRVRSAQLLMAEAGVARPVYITEIGLGQWQEADDPEAYEQMKARWVREVLPLLAGASDHVAWWTSVRVGNQHGLMRNEGDRFRPMPVYYAVGEVTGRLSAAGGPVKVEVIVGDGSVVRLVARNTSARAQTVRFWPVGFVTSLGCTLGDVRGHDWQGTLEPGERHEAAIAVRPVEDAEGRYPVGLAVVTQQGNSLAMADVHVGPRDGAERGAAESGAKADRAP
jgi:hypothetical protein